MRTLALIAAVSFGTPANADRLPHKTTLKSAAEVHCGPGEKFYPTAKLAAGTEVRVLRVDPGGWMMIAPPAGSFSWVLAAEMEVAGKVAKAKQNNVVVRVGSAITKSRDIEQRRLQKGEAVNVLGEETVGGHKFLKIASPAGEFRWVKATALSTVPATDVATADAKPFPDAKAPPSTAASQLENASRVRLKQIDEAFSEILTRKITEWDFTAVERDYVELQKDVPNAKLEGEIDHRLAELDKFKSRRKAYDEFIRVISRTDQKDAALRKQWEALKKEVRPAKTPVLRVSSTRPKAEPKRKRKTRFDGAGIIRRVGSKLPGGPEYAITDQNGRVLAYLIPAINTNLDFARHAGQAMGITGDRKHEDALQADRILVEKLTPVRLAAP